MVRGRPSAAAARSRPGLKDIILFADEADAQAAGFHSRRAAAEPPAAAAGRRALQDVAPDAMLNAVDLRRRSPPAAAAFLFGYLCGSIPFGVILTRLAGTQDIRSVGSGNIGATNVLRTGSKALAAATLLGDMLKGTAAVLIVL